MIHRSFLLRTFFLLIILAAVLLIIVTLMRDDLSDTAQQGLYDKTFFEQFVKTGGPIVWFILLPISLITVYLAVENFLTIRRKKLLPADIGPGIIEVIKQFGPAQLRTRLAGQTDFVSIAVVNAVNQGKGDWFRMRNALFESLQEQSLRFLRRIEWLNLIGNVSPMVGLFGTVFGMIKLFNAIVTAGGQPQPGQLAEGISVALVTTFWGLFIAIPALAIHGVFRNRIEALASDAVAEAENVISEVRRSLKKHQQRIQQPKQNQPEIKPERPVRQGPSA